MCGIILKARPARLQLEAANPRHEHERTVWRDAGEPDDKLLVSGLIDSCSNDVKHPELIAQRIERFAGFVGAERVIAGRIAASAPSSATVRSIRR